ncbi:MAG: TRAP transporter substrate-binding protein DctP [Desulfobulbaceae bacterium]|nr:TRAP transporter substrate-binding protein DctP [Desulfobulbaceae bacterium]HIJ78763.1 TRAP transporter substrate-binding protein DctP [Deltaproteobacteria bacterium]
MSRILKLICAILLIMAFVLPASAWSKRPKYLFKIATLAPEGSVWVKHFENFTREIAEKSNGEIGFKIYMGGVMGDDRAMYRKMRIGQLQGGGFTMTGISEVVPDFRVMGIPFLMKTYDEVDRVSKSLFPIFQKEFADNGLVLLAMTEVGFIYTMSTEPMTTLAELRRRKCWAPDNDLVSRAYLEDLGVTPVPLAIPDVLPSLQTGLINTVFNGFYGSIIMQWFTSTKYIIDVPFGYAYGGLVFSKEAYDKLPPDYVVLMREQAEKHFAGLLVDTRKSNDEAFSVLLAKGAQMVKPDNGSLDMLHQQRAVTVERLNGNVFSKEIYDAAIRALEQGGDGKTVQSR